MPRQETVRVIRSDIVSPAGSPAGLEERIQRGRWVWVWGSLSQFICPLEPMAKTIAWQLLPSKAVCFSCTCGSLQILDTDT